MRVTGYAIAEIVSWLLVGAVIGVAVGWLLRKWLAGRHLEDSYTAIRAGEENRRGELQRELDEHKRQVAGFSSNLDLRTADIERLQAKIADHETKAAEAEAKLKAARAAIRKAEAQVEDRESTIASLRGHLDKSNSKLVEAESSHAGAEETIVSLRTELEAKEAEIALLIGKTDEMQARITELESGATAAAPSELPERDVAVAKVAGIATRTRGVGPTVDDDLKKIHGVGPKLEGLLKSMDITSFRQVANFTTEDIRYVTAALDAFPGRIERDDWMASATEEHAKKYNEPA